MERQAVAGRRIGPLELPADSSASATKAPAPRASATGPVLTPKVLSSPNRDHVRPSDDDHAAPTLRGVGVCGRVMWTPTATKPPCHAATADTYPHPKECSPPSI